MYRFVTKAFNPALGVLVAEDLKERVGCLLPRTPSEEVSVWRDQCPCAQQDVSAGGGMGMLPPQA